MCVYNKIFTEIVKNWHKQDKESKVIVGSIVSPQKMDYSLNPGTQECEFIWRWGLGRCH